MSHPKVNTLIPEVIASSLFGYSGITEQNINSNIKRFVIAFHNEDGSYLTYTVPDTNGEPKVTYPTMSIPREYLQGYFDEELAGTDYVTASSIGKLNIRKFFNFYGTFPEQLGEIQFPPIYGISLNTEHPTSITNKVIAYEAMRGSATFPTSGEFLDAKGYTFYFNSLQFVNPITQNGSSFTRTDLNMLSENGFPFIDFISKLGSEKIYESLFNRLKANTDGVYIGLMLGNSTNTSLTQQVFVDGNNVDYYLYEPSKDTGYRRQKMNTSDWTFTVNQHQQQPDGTTIAVPNVVVANNKVVQFPAITSSYGAPIFAIGVYLDDVEGDASRIITLPLKSRTFLNPGDSPANFPIGKLKFVLTSGNQTHSYK